MTELNTKTFETISVNDDSLKLHSLWKNNKVNSIKVKKTNNGFITTKVIYKEGFSD